MTPVALSPDATALFCTVVVTFGLMLKVLAVAVTMGGARIKAGDRPPEDGPMFKAEGEKRGLRYGFAAAPGEGGGVDAAAVDSKQRRDAEEAAATTARFVRIMTNDLENIPLGLFVAWASVLTATEDWAVTLHIIAVLAFFVGRVLHTVCFVAQKQPMRSLTYTTAVVAVIVMGVNGVIASARWL